MNWDDLRFFLALARCGTVSAAGRDLKVRHTTVSRRIKTLEQRLGTRLFDHLPGGYSMTPAGESLFNRPPPTMWSRAWWSPTSIESVIAIPPSTCNC